MAKSMSYVVFKDGQKLLSQAYDPMQFLYLYCLSRILVSVSGSE